MITLNKKGVFEMSQQKPAFSTAATARHILVCLLLFLAGDLLSSLAFDLLFAVARPPAPWLYQLPRALGQTGAELNELAARLEKKPENKPEEKG